MARCVHENKGTMNARAGLAALAVMSQCPNELQGVVGFITIMAARRKSERVSTSVMRHAFMGHDASHIPAT
jgi:hypothetical protein